MKRMILLLLGLAIIGVAGLFWFNQKNSEKSEVSVGPFEKAPKRAEPQLDSAPEIGGSAESNQDQRSPGIVSKGDLQGTQEEIRLKNHLAAMDAVGPDAEKSYQESLAELKKDPTQNIRILSEAYQNMSEARYIDRWKVVQTIVAIQGDEGLEPLQSIAKQPIPPERFPESHGMGSTGEERAIHMTAIDGMASLAKNGNHDAESALLQLAVETENISLQRRAIRGYLASGENFEERANILRKQIDPNKYHLINLDVTALDEVMPEFESDLQGTLPPGAKMKEKAFGSFLGWLESAGIPSAWAEECYHPITEGKNGEPYVDVPAIYEARYSSSAWCSKPKVEKMWKDFKLENKFWDATAGFSQPCSLDFPLGRTLNTLWFLLTSDPDPAWSLDDRNGTILRWGYNYAATVSTHLRLVCDGTIQHALAFYNTPSGTINVTWSWAMGSDIVNRAGNIVHEARHNKKPHVPPEPGCSRGFSCDPNWAYNGANTYEVSWYWKFFRSAVNTTSAHKDRAKVLAQMVIDEAFNDPPDFTVY